MRRDRRNGLCLAKRTAQSCLPVKTLLKVRFRLGSIAASNKFSRSAILSDTSL